MAVAVVGYIYKLGEQSTCLMARTHCKLDTRLRVTLIQLLTPVDRSPPEKAAIPL